MGPHHLCSTNLGTILNPRSLSHGGFSDCKPEGTPQVHRLAAAMKRPPLTSAGMYWQTLTSWLQDAVIQS